MECVLKTLIIRGKGGVRSFCYGQKWWISFLKTLPCCWDDMKQINPWRTVTRCLCLLRKPPISHNSELFNWFRSVAAAVTMKVTMTIESIYSHWWYIVTLIIDGKSDEYDDKLLDGEKKSTPAANLNDLESHHHQFGCICVPWFSCFVCNSFDWCGGLIYTHENHLRTLLNLGKSILLLNSRLLEIKEQNLSDSSKINLRSIHWAQSSLNLHIFVLFCLISCALECIGPFELHMTQSQML